jgi:hypothetical protein
VGTHHGAALESYAGARSRLRGPVRVSATA